MNRTRFLLFACFCLLLAPAAQAQFEIKGGATNLLDQRRAGAFATVTPPTYGLTAASFTLTLGDSNTAQRYNSSSLPTATISGGGGTGAFATVNVVSTGGPNRRVTGITITNPGTGYTSAPTITFSGGTITQAGIPPTGVGNANNFTVVATGDAIASITVANGGSGYTVAPTVTIGPPASGTTATATAVLTGGVVTSITVNSGGTGYSYTSPPTVSIAPPVTPSGAAVTTPQFAGVGNTSATAGALSTNGITAGRYPQATDVSIPAAPVVTLVVARMSFGHSFASGVPRYYMGDEITRPTVKWDGSPTLATYWRSKPVQPGESLTPAYLTNLGGATQPLAAMGTVTVTSSSTATPTVIVSSVPTTLVNGATLLGQRVNIVKGTTITLAGNASQTIASSTAVQFAPSPAFYYSPHANKVFATQPGRVTLTWVSVAPDTSAPGESTPTYKFRTEVFSVSSASSRPARTMFWTEKSFNGPIISIPNGRIVVANPIYHTYMPSHVPDEFVPVGFNPNTDPNAQPPDEFRTLWFENSNGQGYVRAYNQEGRIFVEYLGALQQGANSVHEFLGADIVEVKRVAESTIIETKLGEQLRPRQESVQDGDDQLTPSIVFNINQTTKPLYGTSTRPNGRLVYHAERENDNPDKVQIYWLEETDAAIHFLTPPSAPQLAIQWPKYLRKYTLAWPAAIGEFEPMTVMTDGNSVASGPKFEPARLPQVIYQDDPEETEVSIDINTQRLLANFTASTDKTSRTLLKFFSGGTPWYVRLYIQSQNLLGSPAVPEVPDPDGAGPLTGTPAIPAVYTLNDLNADGVADIVATVDVGDRIAPPSPAYSVAGYIASGDNYYPAGYRNPFTSGVAAAEAGAIIPVNALAGNNQLTVWWFKQVVAPNASFASFYVPAVAGRYTVQYPAAPPEIVIASGLGTGTLGPSQALGSIYYQNDSTQPGFNPNEEHALIVDGRGYALRDDLNSASTSEPFVLIAYEELDGRPEMEAYKVLRSNATYPLTYVRSAGIKVQPPAPLFTRPPPLRPDGTAYTTEHVITADDATGAGAPDSYDSFTFQDKEGYRWLYRGAHSTGAPSFGMKFYYNSLPGFFIPGATTQPAVGTVMPFIADTGGGVSVTLTFLPKWPDDPALPVEDRKVLGVLKTAETLTLAKNNLPQVRGAASAQVIYQQSIANTGSTNNSVLLHDPTRLKTFALGGAGQMQTLPASVLTSDYAGRTYFQKLPPHLQQRVYFQSTLGAKGSLVLKGEFVDEAVGEDYLHLNALSLADVADLKGLCTESGTVKTNWDAAIDALSTKLETFSESTTVPGTYVVDPAKDSRTIGTRFLADIRDPDTAVDSYALSATGKGTGYVTLVFNNGEAFTDSGDNVTMQIIKVDPELYTGELKVLISSNPLDEQVTLRHNGDFAAQPELYEFQWRYGFGNPQIEAGNIDYANSTSTWIKPNGELTNQIVVGGSATATITAPAVLMGDTYFTMAYRKVVAGQAPDAGWSPWMPQKLVEGWVKRVLAKITPFNQRMTDLANNAINTDVSLLTQAGKRWEGDIALNLENINDAGLIEIYETILNRAKSFTVGSGIDFDSANNALILAAGYLNDLYTILGNEAYADAANPTISIDDQTTVTEVNTSRFSFESQVSSSLDEELALLRGRDDFVNPGVSLSPAYNRLWWNYTRGINSGEVLYAVNYNIKEKSGTSTENGIVDAADAQRMFPQGHGDAYGHYLTALKGYYKLLTHPYFTWIARAEDITILGQSVQVDYKDERKFAAAAANAATTAQQVVSLVHRQKYQDDPAAGWSHYRDGKENPTTHVVRHQGLDESVSRSAQGSFFNWVVGNALLPEEDTNPNHTGVQIIDRTTVPELNTLVTAASAFQSTIDNASAHLNPLGLSPGAIAFDISAAELRAGHSHFEQIYDRALRSVLNARGAFNQAAKMTRLLRNQENQLGDYNIAILEQEDAFVDSLVDIFGTPYAGDVGVGKTYATDYYGPDLQHWFVVDRPTDLVDTSLTTTITVEVPTQIPTFTGDHVFEMTLDGITPVSTVQKTLTIQPNKNLQWSTIWGGTSFGQRSKTGRLQQALIDTYLAQVTLLETHQQLQVLRKRFKREFQLFNELVESHQDQLDARDDNQAKVVAFKSVQVFTEALAEALEESSEAAEEGADAAAEFIPTDTGLANDIGAPERGAIKLAGSITKEITGFIALASSAAAMAFDIDLEREPLQLERDLADIGFTQEQLQQAYEFEKLYREFVSQHFQLAQQATAYQRANEEIRSLISDADVILASREQFRQRAAALINGYRTKDLTFRTFRNEALEQYRTLFDLSSRYTYLAAKSYDYETGLLGSTEGKALISSIVASRALGDLTGDVPQATVSTLGDAGLAGTMAQLNADFSVAEGRLGINNPDTYGTLFSLRGELFRIRTDAAVTSDDDAWKQTMEQYIVANVLADSDVVKYCNNIKKASGAPVPGIVIPFSTTIQNGLNFFGLPLAAGDHAYTASSYSTKISSVGVVLPGYVGMDPYAVGTPGAGSPASGSPNALSATPYVYLIPAGNDFMLAPPLGDTNTVRSWTVHDQALPLPYNLGATAFNTTSFFDANGTLSEQPWILRKHQSFRPVADPAFFYSSVPGEFTNSRLVARSVWNSRWKIVIPAFTLLSNEQDGLNRFVSSVRDIQLFLRTYSHSGN